MPRLSVYIMAQNEENRIRKALESARPIADELVVIDGGSTDRTVEVARSIADRVIVHPFEGYARQRAFALTQVSGDWVLALDADETLSPELQEAIPKLLDQQVIDAFEFSRRNYVKPGVWMRYGGKYPDYQRRLFRRGKATYGEVVHAGEVPTVDGVVARINLDIYHDQIEKNIQYSFSRLMKFVGAEIRETKRTRHPLFHLVNSVWLFLFSIVKKYILQHGYKMGMLGVRVALSEALLQSFVQVGLALKAIGATGRNTGDRAPDSNHRTARTP